MKSKGEMDFLPGSDGVLECWRMIRSSLQNSISPALHSQATCGSTPSPPVANFLRVDSAPANPLPPLTASTLYLVATPIGNLEDITLRALRTLRECDVIAAEDTRRTGQLLRHFGFSKPLISYHKFNEASRSEDILNRLGRGEKVALVSDAGSPGISDPGERVVRAAVAGGFRVETVPGACALIAALTASGLPTDEFHFIGFLPHKSGQRRKKLEGLKTFGGTLVLYESPYRVEKLLGELAEIFPARRTVFARELTKKFEEFLRGTPAEITAKLKGRSIKGEFVVMIGAGEDEAAESSPET
jgi:16S rRNA (cytidine1402-2'-O)-methyltransferase